MKKMITISLLTLISTSAFSQTKKLTCVSTLEKLGSGTERVVIKKDIQEKNLKLINENEDLIDYVVVGDEAFSFNYSVYTKKGQITAAVIGQEEEIFNVWIRDVKLTSLKMEAYAVPTPSQQDSNYRSLKLECKVR